MSKSKNILAIVILCLTIPSFGQTKTTEPKSAHYQALAKLISFEGGDKIHFAKFIIIKDLSSTSILSDTILVGYYNYKQPDGRIDHVLLTLRKYDGQTTMKNYFICPDYDGTANIQKANIALIAFDYWEGCETGKGECNPLTFTSTKTEENWFLIMPCGGTETSITISGENFFKKLHLKNDNCPPYLELSNLADGKYSANMAACGLGGTVTFYLITK
jgi:hypothetical protein